MVPFSAPISHHEYSCVYQQNGCGRFRHRHNVQYTPKECLQLFVDVDVDVDVDGANPEPVHVQHCNTSCFRRDQFSFAKNPAESLPHSADCRGVPMKIL